MKRTPYAALHTRLTTRERARIVQIDALLQAYVQARTRHHASYPADLVSAHAAAAELTRALLEALADVAPTSRELQGLAFQWETMRSRHAAQLTAGGTAL